MVKGGTPSVVRMTFEVFESRAVLAENAKFLGDLLENVKKMSKKGKWKTNGAATYKLADPDEEELRNPSPHSRVY